MRAGIASRVERCHAVSVDFIALGASSVNAALVDGAGYRHPVGAGRGDDQLPDVDHQIEAVRIAQVGRRDRAGGGVGEVGVALL